MIDTLSGTTIRAVCEAASGGKLHPDARTARVRLWGVHALLVYRLNAAEHARRQAVSTPPLDDLGLLSALLKLPVGQPVPWASLAARDRRLLARGEASHSWVRRGDTAVRLAVPAVTVDLAVVRSKHARPEALDVMPFGAYVPQSIWLDCPPDGSAALLAEAARYSTGVVHWQGEGEPRVLAPAQPLTEVHETPAGWRFDEQAYGQILALPDAPGQAHPLA